MIEALLMLKAPELGRLVHKLLCDHIGRESLQELSGAEKYLYPVIQSIIIEPMDKSAVIIDPAEGGTA